MRRFTFIFLAIGFILTSCTDRDDDVNAVNIRIRNVSSLTFDEVQVGEQEAPYTSISPDSFSDYMEYESAYRYAYIAITSGEETYVLQPIDFVGETELPTGLYTYELDVTEEGGVLLEFVAD
jgi:hypothetical protein